MFGQRIISKITLPDLTRAISRPRLIQRATDAGATRVILITGQAAQGKSTLAAEIARLPGPTGVWLHLDSPDSDPVNFFRLLVHAFKVSRPGRDVSAFLKKPGIALGTRSGSARIAELATVFLDEVVSREPVRIVMDGLDRISGNPESLALIQTVLEAISPPGCLVIVSRETPPLSLESLRISQELVMLDNAELAFTIDEIFRFFSELHGLRLTPPQLSVIRKVTDGWAGGLVLVWEALSRVPEDQRCAFINRGLPAAMHGERLAYFSEAVFSGLDGATRDFLIRSSIFETINPDMAACYLENQPVASVETIIDTMVRRNLFIHPLYDEKTGWVYRYNQLFRDFLLDKFHRVHDKPMQQMFYARAADLAWDAGHFEDAIRFFLKAESFDKAAAGIKKIAMGLSAQGRFADLAGWVDILPDAIVDDDTWLSLYRAVGRRISGGRRNIPSFSRALDRFSMEGDERGQLLALAYLIEAAVFIGHPAAALNPWLESAWAMLERVSGSRYYPFAKAVLWMQVAFGYISGAGDLQKGLSACRNAMLLATTIRDETLTVNATIIHVFGFAMAGEFDAAEKALATIEKIVAAAYPEYRALRNLVRIKLALSKGDLDRAQRLLDANQEDIDRFGLLFLYPVHVDVSGLLQIRQGRYDAVGRTARHLKDVATLVANPLYNGLAMRLRALKAYHQGHFDRARMWAEEAAKVIALSLGESIHLFRSRLISGMAAYHLEDMADARQALESARDFFSRVSSHLSLVEARLGLSLVARAMGEVTEADGHLESALALAASKGYDAFPILSSDDVAAACSPVIPHARSEISGLSSCHMVRLPVQLPASSVDTPGGDGPPTQDPVEAVGIERVGYHVDIRTLGGFKVRLYDGDVVSDARWTGLRQKLLLKAILVNGCREIPKDILMDALWPESGHEAALKRFKVTLHRLRRILEPGADYRSVSSFISLKDNLVSLDMERCRVDVNEFLAACDEIRQLKHDDDDRRLLPACRRAAAIYRGDFLPEETYLRSADMKRAVLKDHYLGVLMEMADFFERKGNLDQAVRNCQAVTRADPLDEQAHQQLMRLLHRQGRRSAALKVYRGLAETLLAELDTVPDPATTKIYQEIITLS